MPPYYYHLKLELYATPDPTATAANAAQTVPDESIWVPAPGASIFDDLPSHPRSRHSTPTSRPTATTTNSEDYSGECSGHRGAVSAYQYPPVSSKIIDCGSQRGKTHDDSGGVFDLARGGGGGGGNDGRNFVRLSERQYRERFQAPVEGAIEGEGALERAPRFEDGIGPATAVRDWRFGRVRIESVDTDKDRDTRSGSGSSKGGGERRNNSDTMVVGGQEDGAAGAAAAAPAASLGPNLGGMGLATKARYVPLETKNTEAGWGIVHLYREGDESGAWGPALESGGAGSSGGGRGMDGGDEGTILCIPAVPSYMGPSDVLGFIGEKWRGDVSHYRMIMTSRMSRYMVLLKFRDAKRAREWRKEFDGKPFDSVETEICHVTFIKSITVETPNQTSSQRKPSEGTNDRFSPTSPNVVNSLKPFPPPTPNLIELPTCAVCLERMDDTAGLMTILCQHVFHCTCLQTWKGSGCPICRATNPKPPNQEIYDPENPYSQPFGSGVSNICNNCNCTDDLWICLICGNVGCGRYNGGHAKEHWKRTAHSFSLELETQHVWDYAGDMWVHRLIRNKGDGKIVELPRNNTNDQQLPSGPTPGGEDVVPRAKLDSIGMEYTHLLTSQLESQRLYFEEMVSKAADKAAKASAAAESASAQAGEALRQLEALREEHRALKEETVPALERDLAREKMRAAKSADLARSLGRALQEEKEVSAGLMKRIEHLQGEAEVAGKEMAKLREQNAELQEMNRDLTMFISGQEKLREMEKEGVVEQGELEDGKVAVAEGSGSGSGSSRRKGKGRAKK
ncbi:hypothetical protein VTK26DRAFT_3475 [Humicola hyalothermophila]